MKIARLPVCLCLLTVMTAAVFAMGEGASDEMKFMGSSDVIKPSPIMTKLTKITSTGHNVYPACAGDGDIAFQTYTEEETVNSEGSKVPVGVFNIMISNGNTYSMVTNDKHKNEFPAFVNDQKIIFSSNRMWNEKLWIADASGKGGLIQLTSSNTNDFFPNVSRDGKKVVFSSFMKFFTPPLSVANLGARWMIWGMLGEMPTIWMVDVDGRNLTQFTEGIRPVWSFDGKKIAYYKQTGKYYQVWVMDADGSNQTQLTNGEYNSIEPSWTPDGRLVFASNAAGNYDIWSQKIDGTELTQLTIQDSYEGAPACSYDGKYVYFHSFLGKSWNIWQMELAKPFQGDGAKVHTAN